MVQRFDIPSRPLLAPGHRVGAFELQGALPDAGTADSVLYKAWDHALARPVAIAEYLPRGGARRDSDGTLHPMSATAAATHAAGLSRFIAQTRWLAEADHPSLLRVLHLVQAPGTAYRVMPWYRGQPLAALRRRMPAPPDEPALRVLLDDLLGALQALHRGGHVHAAVHPDNILVLDDDRALLLAPGHDDIAGGTRPDPADDCRALAQVARFCITGMLHEAAGGAASEPLATTVERLFFDSPEVRYSPALLQALDRAGATDRSTAARSVAEFRAWLSDATTASSATPAAKAATAGADVLDMEVDAQTRQVIQRVIDAVPERVEPRLGPAPPPAASAAPPSTPARQPSGARGRSPRTALVTVAVLALFGVAAATAFEPARQLLAGLHADPAQPAPVAVEQADAPAPAVAATSAVAVPAPQAAADIAGMDLDALPAPAGGPASPDPVPPDPAPAAGDRPAAPPQRKAVAAARSPREACGERTQFSLFRCMERLCAQPVWRPHAQCESLRRTGDIE